MPTGKPQLPSVPDCLGTPFEPVTDYTAVRELVHMPMSGVVQWYIPSPCPSSVCVVKEESLESFTNAVHIVNIHT